MLKGPLQVYGRRGNPKQIALLLARSLPGAQVEQDGGDYRVAVRSQKGIFRQKEPTLVVDINADGFGAEEDVARHALHDDLVNSIRGPGLDEVLAMIPELQIGLAFRPADPERRRHGDRLALIALDMAARLDGFVVDLHNGRLISTTGEVLGTTELYQSEGGTPVDPSLQRVHGRLVALLAVAARALTEYDGLDLEEAREGISRWVRSSGLGAELEPHEKAFLDRPAGELDDADLAYGSWQVEGAGVLAWALELIEELPTYDQPMDPTLLTGLLCFPDATSTQAVLGQCRRRFQASVETEAQHQRTNYHQLRENAAGGGAGAEEVDMALAITTERLRACNWLTAGGLYSATGP